MRKVRIDYIIIHLCDKIGVYLGARLDFVYGIYLYRAKSRLLSGRSIEEILQIKIGDLR